MRRLLIATTNPGKLGEYRTFLDGSGISVQSLSDIGISDSPAETGFTYLENARIKAEFYGSRSGLPVLADDGGFEIDALNGEPGVKSHRWIHGDREDGDEEIIAYVMKRMKDIPTNGRGAQLRVVIYVAMPDGRSASSEAVIRGVIPPKPSPFRRKGFPYRSLLFIPELQRFYHDNDLPSEVNLRYNHRKLALDKLIPTLRTFLQETAVRSDPS